MFGEARKLSFPISGKCQACLDIFFREVREIRENFFLTHPAGQVFQYIGHRHARAPNRRLAATFARLDGDDLAIIHAAMITKRIHLAN